MYCQLETIPEDLLKVEGLKKLNLSSNLFALEDLSRLAKLKTLEVLRVNRLHAEKHVLPDYIQELKSLKELYCTNCNLSHIPFWLPILRNLKVLDISSNPIDTIPKTLVKCTRLETLIMAYGKGYLGFLPEDEKGRFGIKKLDLRQTPLVNTRSILKAICTYKKLEELNLHSANVYSDMLGDIGALSKLKTLDLLGTNLDEFPLALTTLEHLEFLDLRQTAIEELPKEIAKLKKLKSLAIGGNSTYRRNVLFIPNSFQELEALESLRIENVNWMALPDFIGDLPSLEALYLRNVCKEVKTDYEYELFPVADLSQCIHGLKKNENVRVILL